MFPIFLVFVPFILLHSLSLPMFLCSVFVVFWLFSFILVFSRHFKRVPCLFLAVHMSHFYVFSIFGIYTLILLGLLRVGDQKKNNKRIKKNNSQGIKKIL